MIKIDHIDHIALAVTDLERSIRFYCDVLGFEHRFPGIWGGVPVFLGAGDTALALFPTENPINQPKSQDIPFGVLHFAFRASRANFLDAQAQLKTLGIPFSFSDHEISHSIYFRDPDGYLLEITTYELNDDDPNHTHQG